MSCFPLLKNLLLLASFTHLARTIVNISLDLLSHWASNKLIPLFIAKVDMAVILLQLVKFELSSVLNKFTFDLVVFVARSRR